MRVGAHGSTPNDLQSSWIHHRKRVLVLREREQRPLVRRLGRDWTGAQTRLTKAAMETNASFRPKGIVFFLSAQP